MSTQLLCCLRRTDSDHRAVRMELNLTSLKYKEKASLNTGETDWRKICEEDEQRKLYNKYLLYFTTRDMTYDNFCEAVKRAGRETAMSIENKCEGMIRLRDLNDDFYVLDEKNYCIIGQRRKKKYQLGDEVRILVKKVDLAKRQIDFSLVRD